MQTVNQEYIYQDDDGIDLRDIVRTLIKRKKTILLVTAIVFLTALAYALLVSPVYRAQVSFLPPTEADVSALNVTDLTSGTNAEDVYDIFAKNLSSLKVRRNTFNKMNLLNIYKEKAPKDASAAAIFDKFNSDISLEVPKIKERETTIPAIHLALSGSKPELLSEILNELEAAARLATKREVVSDVIETINLRKKQLNRVIFQLRNTAEKQKNDEITRLLEIDQIESQKLVDQIGILRASAKIKRADRIQVLTEAAKIAESLGLTDKSSLLDTNITTNITTASKKDDFYTKMSATPTPLYLRGSKALRSEIKELTSRTSDAPFILELRELQDKLELLKNNPQINSLKTRQDNDPFIEPLRTQESALALLEAININLEQIRVATVDQPAFPPTSHEKPKRFLIALLGLTLGLLLGIITAFLLNFREGMREEDLKLAEENSHEAKP